MLIGYMRPYHGDQDCNMQFKNLTEWNCDKIIREEHPSAKNRTQLKNMINAIKYGDKIIVHKLSALADSTHHLLDLLELLETKGAELYSLTEGIDTSSKDRYQFKHIVEHLVDFQRDIISETTKKGLNKAKQKGVTTGRPRKLDENVKHAINMYQSKKYSLSEIRNETGISKSTLYRYLER